jgi:hypothetical protein
MWGWLFEIYLYIDKTQNLNISHLKLLIQYSYPQKDEVKISKVGTN